MFAGANGVAAGLERPQFPSGRSVHEDRVATDEALDPGPAFHDDDRAGR